MSVDIDTLQELLEAAVGQVASDVDQASDGLEADVLRCLLLTCTRLTESTRLGAFVGIAFPGADPMQMTPQLRCSISPLARLNKALQQGAAVGESARVVRDRLSAAARGCLQSLPESASARWVEEVTSALASRVR